LRGLADYFLVHNREILLRADDLWCVSRVARPASPPVARLCARACIPEGRLPPVLGVGGELKNTICLTRGPEAFLSQHIGDLETLESYKFFESTVAGLKRILEIEPKILAYDLHPDYFPHAGRWRRRAWSAWGFNITTRTLRVAWRKSARRARHRYRSRRHRLWAGWKRLGRGSAGRGLSRVQALRPLGLRPDAGRLRFDRGTSTHGDQLPVSHFGRDFWDLDIPFVRALDRPRTETLLRLIGRGVNSPLTSSAGGCLTRLRPWSEFASASTMKPGGH